MRKNKILTNIKKFVRCSRINMHLIISTRKEHAIAFVWDLTNFTKLLENSASKELLTVTDGIPDSACNEPLNHATCPLLPKRYII